MSLILSGPMLKLPAGGGGGITHAHEHLEYTTSITAEDVTFTGVPVASPEAGREIFVWVFGAMSNATDVTGVTWNGVALTEVASDLPGTYQGWWRGTVATGTSADLVVETDGPTLSPGLSDCMVSVWRVVGAGASPTTSFADTGYQGSGTTSTVSLNTAVGDLVLMTGRHNGSAALAIDVTGVTEDADDDGVTEASNGISVGSAIAGSAETPRALTYTSASEVFSQNAAALVVSEA